MSSTSREKRCALVETLESRVLMTRVMGIDVSDWQGAIDWTNVANSGVGFAYIRASRGGTTGTYDENTKVGTLSQRYDDTNLAANMAAAKAAGIVVGAYHFARPDILTNTGADEAKHFLQVAGAYMTDGYLAPVLDLEVGSARSTANLTAFATSFAQTIHDATGVWPICYTTVSYANTEVSSDVTEMPLWLANLPANPDPVAGDPSSTAYQNPYGVWNSLSNPSPWTYWQYSNMGSVAGLTGSVDMDVFNGDYTGLGTQVIATGLGLSPTMTVTNAGVALDSGTATVDFGTVAQSQPLAVITQTFTVTNTGFTAITLSNMQLPAGYRLTDPLAPTLEPGASDDFTVRLDSLVGGVKAGNITFNSTDLNVPAYSVAVTGLVDVPLPGALRGFVFDDLNGNGVLDSSDTGIAGRTVYIDADNNNSYDSLIDTQSTTTDVNGFYTITGVTPGSVVVRVVPDGTRQIIPADSGGLPGGLTVAIATGVTMTMKPIGFVTPTTISGAVIGDLNGNGVITGGETGLANWTVYIDTNRNGVLDSGEMSTVTDSSGAWMFSNLYPATYVVRVVPQSGYKLTAPSAKSGGITLAVLSNVPITNTIFAEQPIVI